MMEMDQVRRLNYSLSPKAYFDWCKKALKQLRYGFGTVGDLKPYEFDATGKITDPKKFVQSHIKMCAAQMGNPVFHPYYCRLIEYLKFLQNGN
jgi:hypothetical protein